MPNGRCCLAFPPAAGAAGGEHMMSGGVELMPRDAPAELQRWALIPADSGVAAPGSSGSSLARAPVFNIKVSAGACDSSCTGSIAAGSSSSTHGASTVADSNACGSDTVISSIASSIGSFSSIHTSGNGILVGSSSIAGPASVAGTLMSAAAGSDGSSLRSGSTLRRSSSSSSRGGPAGAVPASVASTSGSGSGSAGLFYICATGGQGKRYLSRASNGAGNGLELRWRDKASNLQVGASPYARP